MDFPFKSSLPVFILLLCMGTANFSVAQTSTQNGSNEVLFEHDRYDSLLTAAKESAKLILIDFRADWCRPCILMERTTFKDSTLAGFVNANFVAYKADTELSKNRNLQSKYRISSLPTLIVINPNKPDEVLLRVIGYTPADILLEDLRSMRDSKGNKIFD